MLHLGQFLFSHIKVPHFGRMIMIFALFCSRKNVNITFVYCFETNQWKPFSPVKLSERERTVLYLSCQGQTTRDIAKSLPFSYGTINRIKDRIFEKTETSSIMEATTFCINNRMV